MLLASIVFLVSIPVAIFYWTKWSIAYIAICIYNATHKRRFDLYNFSSTGKPEKIGFLIPEVERDLESPLSESHLQEAADEILFYGVNQQSECLLVRIARGCNQAAEAWIYLKLANGKTYHLIENANYQQPFDGKCMNFSCGNLQMHYLAPMRRWRIHYCGLLREKCENNEKPEETTFVKFVFLWTASSDVYDPTPHTNPKGFATAMARCDWESPFRPPVHKLPEALDFYSQVGTVKGFISVNEGDEYEMYLFGEKFRNMGKSSTTAGCNFQTLLGYSPETGFALHLMKSSVPKLYNNIPVGFLVRPAGSMHTVTDLDITIKPYNPKKARRDFQASFFTGKAYSISGNISAKPIVLCSGEGWNGFIELFFMNFTVNDKHGLGLILSGEVYNEPRIVPKPTVRTLFPKTIPLTVKFSDQISHFGDISGGKGSSLGKLTQLSQTDKTFVVPKGIIVTTSAFEAFLTSAIMEAVKNLENVMYGKVKGDVKELCEVAANNVMNNALPNKICQSITEDLKSVFGDKFRDIKFAVRSSATGEDTDVMSAAGQMDTFLGVQGVQEIFVAVKKCWASQFGYIAVEYKRQNGQILNSPMAVVIQEMVSSEVSGVLFTCDPLTNNPSIITITANYGLGETVVSGSVEPDTIILQRSENDQLEVKSINIGSKHQRIVLKESGGTVTEDLPEDSKTDSCITKETAITLGKLAIRVEKYYRSARDIEWGIVNENVYLLQSRPVTSGSAVTDFEVKHEFDSPLRSEKDYFTKANVGEVMPDVTSPLGSDLLFKFFNSSLMKQSLETGRVDLFAKSTYFYSGLQNFYNHMMIGVVEMINRHGYDETFSKGLMISIFGRILDEPELLEITLDRTKQIPKPSIKTDIAFLKDVLFHERSVNKLKNRIENYDRLFLKTKTSEEAFEALMDSCSDFSESICQHLRFLEYSSHWNIVMFLILVKAKGSFDTDVYGDFGRLLSSSSNLESADIPSAMQAVANQIVKDLGAEKFQSMNLEEAENWLNKSTTLAGQQFRQFIARHGHRCLGEFDVHSVTWDEDTKSLLKLLQTLATSGKESSEKEDESYSKIFSELRVSIDFLNRVLLRIVLPNCRKGVWAREAGKSTMIKSIDHWRKGYRHLGKLMVAEGRIPDEDLLYFMTMDEIDTLLKTRYPKVIAVANHRRKLFPVLKKYQFPELMQGIPVPVNERDTSEYDTSEYVADLTMQGIPVSQGVTKGYARVATCLEEASLLQPGEILIAYSTDIGWSPYFPIISGVVTELGGLISHGAVVSREYGLPCVVGCQGATKQFKTGDFVLLDGKKGILKRLPQPKE